MRQRSGRFRAGTRRAALLLLGVTALVLVPALPASAHPLGNFTINHYDGLVLHPDRIADTAVVDSAELPTLQERDSIDVDGNGTVTPHERSAFAANRCRLVAQQVHIEVNGIPLRWDVTRTSYTYRPGAAGLQISRLECDLTTKVDLSNPAVVRLSDGYLSDRIGWREITASGKGIALDHPSVAAQSISDELRSYPNDLLSSPLDQREVKLSVAPGQSTGVAQLPTVPDVGFASRILGSGTNTLDRLVGSKLTLPVGLLALLLSLVLGAAHAVLPGHGKTIMAAYMVGTRGTPRDALLIGVTVTLAHTTGVLVLGLLFSAGTSFAGESLLAILGVVSGLLVAVIGVGLLRAALRGRGYDALSPQHSHGDDHGHSHGGDGHSHGHGHGHDGHSHDRGRDHSHDPHSDSHPHAYRDASGASVGVTVLRPAREDVDVSAPGHSHGQPHHDRGYKRLTLVGMGLAGGLVPSPSALVVLLGSIALGRTPFGIALVLGYGVGMAATLMAVGYFIARLPSRFGRLRALSHRPSMARLVQIGPVLTAGLVFVVGLGLALRSAAPFM